MQNTLWSYEVGAKTAWLDRRLTINGDVYYIDWSRIQQLVALPTCGLDFTGNFGSATSKGSEIEIQYEPLSGLRLSVSAAYNEAELRSTVSGAQGRAGDTLENAPRWMGFASGEYNRLFATDYSGYARLDLSTISHQFNNFDPTNIYYERAGYSVANMRIGAKHQL